MANSMLAICDGATILPATLITKMLPIPWPNTTFAGTRESEQPSISAKDSVLSANSVLDFYMRRRVDYTNRQLRVLSSKK